MLYLIILQVSQADINKQSFNCILYILYILYLIITVNL